MSVLKITKTLPLCLLFVGSVWAQEVTQGAAGTQNQEREKQIDVAKQAYERLRKADFAKLEIARPPLELNQSPEELTKPLKAGNGIHFRLLITNTSNNPVGVPIGNSYTQTRPVLLRGGDPVPYRKGIDELLARVDDDPVFDSAKGAHLEPGETIATNIDLKDWYEPLKPGYYELKVRMRFIWGGTWVESSDITFEVEPDRANHGRSRGVAWPLSLAGPSLRFERDLEPAGRKENDNGKSEVVLVGGCDYSRVLGNRLVTASLSHNGPICRGD
jgi:hypothetical protein